MSPGPPSPSRAVRAIQSHPGLRPDPPSCGRRCIIMMPEAQAPTRRLSSWRHSWPSPARCPPPPGPAPASHCQASMSLAVPSSQIRGGRPGESRGTDSDDNHDGPRPSRAAPAGPRCPPGAQWSGSAGRVRARRAVAVTGLVLPHWHWPRRTAGGHGVRALSIGPKFDADNHDQGKWHGCRTAAAPPGLGTPLLMQ